MFGTIIHNSITFFRTHEAAMKVATANNAAGDGWTYTVEHWDRGHVIVVFDEDGHRLGTL